MTFSIAARSADAGLFGIAIASSSPAVAARCAHARAGAGAVATQISISMANNNPANIFMPAVAKFFEMFSAGKDVAEGETVIDEVRRTIKPQHNITIEDVEAREYHRNAFAIA